MKLLVLGFDALSWPILKDAKDRWPKLWDCNPQPLHSPLSITGPAWTTLYTGWPVEKHGVTHTWGIAQKGSLDLKTTPAPLWWERFPGTVGLVNLPCMPDAMPVNGFCVSGWPRSYPQVYPEELKECLPPNYQVDMTASVGFVGHRSPDFMVNEAYKVVYPRLMGAKALYEAMPVDVLFVQWSFLDRLGHICQHKKEPQIVERGYGILEDLMTHIAWAFFGFEKMVVISDHGWEGLDHHPRGVIAGRHVNLEGVKETKDFVPWLWRELELGEADLSSATQEEKEQRTKPVYTKEEKEEIEERLEGLGYK